MEKRIHLVYLAVILILALAIAFLCGMVLGGSKPYEPGLVAQVPKTAVPVSSTGLVTSNQPVQSKKKPNESYDAEFIKSVKNRATGYGISPNWYLVLVMSANEAGVSEAHLNAMIRSMLWSIQNVERGHADNVARAFRVLGASHQELSVLNTEAKFLAIAQMFKNYNGFESRFALATDIFSGSATSECVAFISQGADQIRSNYVRYKADGLLLTDEQLGEARPAVTVPSSTPSIPNFGSQR